MCHTRSQLDVQVAKDDAVFHLQWETNIMAPVSRLVTLRLILGNLPSLQGRLIARLCSRSGKTSSQRKRARYSSPWDGLPDLTPHDGFRSVLSGFTPMIPMLSPNSSTRLNMPAPSSL